MSFNDLSDFDKGWVVGLIEGEGHIHKRRNRVEMGMSDKDTIEKYHRLMNNGNKKRNINVRKDNRKDTYRTMFRSYVDGEDAVLLMLDIFPFMSERKQLQIQNVILGGLND